MPDTAARAAAAETGSPVREVAESSWPWVYGLWFLVLCFGAVTLLRSWQLGIPIRDPHRSFFWTRLGVFVALAAGVAVVDAVVRTVPPRRRRRVTTTLRHRWTPHRIMLVLSGLVGYQIVYVCYHNLKSWDVFNRPRDQMLFSWDRFLFLGHSPAVLLHDLLGQHTAAYALMMVYESFTAVTSLALVLGLVLADRVRDGYVYLTAAAWVWILGAGSYYLVPSLGPFRSAPAEFAGLPDTKIQRTQARYLDQRAQLLAHPQAHDAFAQVSAFASLHVAVTCLVFLMARYYRLWRTARIMGFYLVTTMLATIYLGWHFAVDDVAGLAIAGTAVILGSRMVYPPHRNTASSAAPGGDRGDAPFRSPEGDRGSAWSYPLSTRLPSYLGVSRRWRRRTSQAESR